MDNRFMRGLIMGGVIGAVTTMMVPRIPPRSRRKILRAGRHIMDRAADVVHEMRKIDR